MDIEKFGLLRICQKDYPKWINPGLRSIKFYGCADMVFLETPFKNDLQKVIITDMNLIGNDSLDGEELLYIQMNF